jgi:hypothetical protein
MNNKTTAIIDEILTELSRAKRKYPKTRRPWEYAPLGLKNERFNILERVALVACEAGEALEAAKSFAGIDIDKFDNSSRQRTYEELIQTASTAIRVLESMGQNNEIDAIIDESLTELEQSKKELPPNLYRMISIFDHITLVSCAALKALNAANKYVFNGTGRSSDIHDALVEVASMAIRVLETME